MSFRRVSSRAISPSGKLRGPATILFISHDACGNMCRKTIWRLFLWGIAQLLRDALQNGVSHRCACVKLSTKGGIAQIWGAVANLASPNKYRAIRGIAPLVSQYRAIRGHQRGKRRQPCGKSTGACAGGRLYQFPSIHVYILRLFGWLRRSNGLYLMRCAEHYLSTNILMRCAATTCPPIQMPRGKLGMSWE